MAYTSAYFCIAVHIHLCIAVHVHLCIAVHVHLCIAVLLLLMFCLVWGMRQLSKAEHREAACAPRWFSSPLPRLLLFLEPFRKLPSINPLVLPQEFQPSHTLEIYRVNKPHLIEIKV